LSGGTLILNSGQTLRGYGTVTGKLTAASGSHVSPGGSPGQITVTADYTLQAGGARRGDQRSVAGSGYDQIVVTGTVQLAAR